MTAVHDAVAHTWIRARTRTRPMMAMASRAAAVKDLVTCGLRYGQSPDRHRLIAHAPLQSMAMVLNSVFGGGEPAQIAAA
jgi:hypothetical protein